VEMDQLLDSMHDRCKQENGEDDPTKGNQLIEIYAMKIERYLRDSQPNFKILKTFIYQSISYKSLVQSKISWHHSREWWKNLLS